VNELQDERTTGDDSLAARKEVSSDDAIKESDENLWLNGGSNGRL
jgi:hypothetical protein